jgi:short-subunit dehydrogenase
MDRNEAGLEETLREILRAGAEVLTICGDVSSQPDVDRALAASLARFLAIDILVLCAGVYVRRHCQDTTTEEFQRLLDVNFFGCVYPVLKALPRMLETRRGHVVLVSSMEAKKGFPADGAYVVSKYALAGFGHVLRQEVRGSGVHVSLVFPGWVDSPMNTEFKVPQIDAKISPQIAARAIVRAIHTGKAETIVPSRARILAYLEAISPRLGDAAVRYLGLDGRRKSSSNRE